MIDLEYGVTITPMFIQSVDQITFINGLGYLSGFCWLPLLNRGIGLGESCYHNYEALKHNKVMLELLHK